MMHFGALHDFRVDIENVNTTMSQLFKY